SAVAAEELSSAAAAVAVATEAAARASTVQSDAASTLPPLRQTEAERGAAHHRLIAQREQLDAEEARARETAQRIRQLIAQGDADAEREKLLEHDADSALADLGREADNLNAANASAAEDLAAAEQLSAEMSESLAESERLLERLTAELAEWNARKASLERGRDLAVALLDSSKSQLADAQARLNTALESAKDAPDVQAAEDETEQARRASEAARAAADAA